MMILKEQVLELPAESQAALVTAVTPMVKANPLGGTLVRLVTKQLSMAVMMKVTLLEQTPGAAWTIRLAGQVINGG